MKLKTYLENVNTKPYYATSDSAGLDLISNNKELIRLKPLERILVPTGLRIALPGGYEAQVRPRSGLSYKHGITVLNAPGTIDADYRGEIKVLLINLGTDDYTIEPKTRIAQLVVAPYTKVELDIVQSTDKLELTDRGSGGFGSTGTK